MSSPRGETFATRWTRRSASFSVLTLAWATSALSVLLLPGVALVDTLRGARLAWSRALLAFFVFLSCELCGLASAGAVWLVRPVLSHERWVALHVRLQRRWVHALWGALCRIYRIELTVEGQDALPSSGPLVVLTRHTSLADCLLPVLVLPGWRPRYVLKRELLWDPCLDVVGRRIHNAFVRRGSENSAAEVSKVRALGEGLCLYDAVAIFPEGTRYTPAKRARVLESLAKSGDAERLQQAESLRHVLPPRPGGTLALLAACPQAHAVLLSHAGLDGAQTFASLANGALIGRTIQVRLVRLPAARSATAASDPSWLREAWADMDCWLAERLPCPAELEAVT